MARRDSITSRAVQALSQEIREGRYAVGESLPSERCLGERYGVSRMTVRVILGRLEGDGLIYRQQGRGTFVVPQARAKPVALWLRDLEKASSPYIVDLMAGADQHLAGLGSHLCLTGAPVQSWPAAFCRDMSGVIVIPFNVDSDDIACLERLGLPHVTVMESDLPGPAVCLDPRGAARAMVRRLLDLGHRRLALVSGHHQHNDRQKRLGIAEALSGYGLRLESIPDFETNYNPEAAQRAAVSALGCRPRPTAVICFDDTLALQVISVAQRLGLRVPEDVSVSGFNDAPFSALVTPAISTVRFPVRLAGQAAARLILEASRSGRSVESLRLAHELIWRQSTATPPAGAADEAATAAPPASAGHPSACDSTATPTAAVATADRLPSSTPT